VPPSVRPADAPGQRWRCLRRGRPVSRSRRRRTLGALVSGILVSGILVSGILVSGIRVREPALAEGVLGLVRLGRVTPSQIAVRGVASAGP
jgi:hypothetical protein